MTVSPVINSSTTFTYNLPSVANAVSNYVFAAKMARANENASAYAFWAQKAVDTFNAR